MPILSLDIRHFDDTRLAIAAHRIKLQMIFVSTLNDMPLGKYCSNDAQT